MKLRIQTNTGGRTHSGWRSHRQTTHAANARATAPKTHRPDPACAALADNRLVRRCREHPGSRIAAMVAFVLLAMEATLPAGEPVLLSSPLTIAETNRTYEGLDLIISNTIVTIDGNHSFQTLLLTNGAVLTCPTATTSRVYKVQLEVSGPVAIDATSRIDVTGKGYLGGRTKGNTTEGASTSYFGGSFGGLGGEFAYPGFRNAVYGDYANPDEWGSGGGIERGQIGSAGGGLVRLRANELRLDGALWANGADTNNLGRGSGGGIHVEVGRLAGTGTIRANGGFGYGGAAGGGGGRVAVFAEDLSGFDLAAISVAGGRPFDHDTSRWQGGAGTLFLKLASEPLGRLIIDQGGGEGGITHLGLLETNHFFIPGPVVIRGQAIVESEHAGLGLVFGQGLRVELGALFRSLGSLSVTGSVEVVDTNTLVETRGRFTVAGDLVVHGGTLVGERIHAASITLSSNGVVTTFVATTNTVHTLDLQVDGAISVDATSRIDVTGKGYLGGRTKGNTTEGASSRYNGGSFGGLGGDLNDIYPGSTLNPVYGDPANPNEWGSGGGIERGQIGSAGGGVVRLRAAELHLDGGLWSNGADTNNRGRGSGGSIYIETGQLAGSGGIRADGGSGLGGAGGGGGGRIAVYAGDWSGFETNRIVADGGSDRAAGSRGTVHFSRLASDGSPELSASPVDAAVALGVPHTFTVSAAGLPPLGYQWRLNGQNIPQATESTYSIPSIDLRNAGTYTVVVSNRAGAIESGPAILTIADIAPLELADRFADRRTFTSASGIGIASNDGATAETGEPRHAGKSGGKSLWMTWQAPADGIATFGTEGSSFDTLLAVYTGTNFVEFGQRANQVANDEDRGGFLTSRLTFNARQGVAYHVAVDGFAGAAGVLVLSWNLEATGELQPVILQPPAPSTLVREGARLELRTAADPPQATYQWTRNGSDLAGQNQALLVLPSVRPEDAGIYRVRIGTPNGRSIESSDSVVEVVPITVPNAAGGVSADKWEDLFALEAQPDGRDLQGTRRPTLLGFTSITLGLGGRHLDLRGATRSPDDPDACGTVYGATRWLRFRSDRARVVHFGVARTEAPVLVAIYEDRVRLHPVASCLVALPGDPAATAAFYVRPAGDYLALVAAVGSSPGRVELSWTGDAPTELPASGIGLRDGRMFLEWVLPPGHHDLSISTDLLHWQSLLSTNTSGWLFQYQDRDLLIHPQRFYRIRSWNE